MFPAFNFQTGFGIKSVEKSFLLFLRIKVINGILFRIYVFLKKILELLFTLFNNYFYIDFDIWRCSDSRLKSIPIRTSQESVSLRSSHQRCSMKKAVLKNLTKFTGKCEFCEISKNTFTYRTPSLAASVLSSDSQYLVRRVYLSLSVQLGILPALASAFFCNILSNYRPNSCQTIYVSSFRQKQFFDTEKI